MATSMSEGESRTTAVKSEEEGRATSETTCEGGGGYSEGSQVHAIHFGTGGLWKEGLGE